MKIAGIFASLALVVTPMLAASQGSDDQSSGAAEAAGGSEDGVLEVYTSGTIPTGAMIVGDVVILDGVIVGVVAEDGSTDGAEN